jgi:hypothetical protein
MFQLNRLLKDINIGKLKNDNHKPSILNPKPKIRTQKNMTNIINWGKNYQQEQKTKRQILIFT